jgi:hypothetical protein
MWAMSRPAHGLILVVALLGLFAVMPAVGDDRLPIVDTHIHYSRNAWSQYGPDAVLAILAGAGVTRAFVSSTPDEGTVRLYEAAPDRVVPVLRPYRESEDLGSWHQDPAIVSYLESRLQRGIHRGIGEFHLSGAQARSPVVTRVAELAAKHGLFLHCHCDAEAAEILTQLNPGVRVLWAHAGMSAGPELVGQLLDRHPTLSTELALRTDVAPDGRLDPAWRAVFLRHPDRIMLGTDTWVPSRWSDLPSVQTWARTWLADLPPDVARGIASGNAERLAVRGR